ncbi:unnamed protein product [Effrenium voratum]|nr:unnamed protein product [Effrenium voratum]
MAEATALMLKALEPEGRRAEQELNDFFRAFCVEAVDDIYKKHADLLAAVYKIFGGSKTPPGKPKYMALGEFQLLLESSPTRRPRGFCCGTPRGPSGWEMSRRG